MSIAADIRKEHVPGRKQGEIVLYALSTCVWCRKTKRLLSELGVEYDYVFVDLLSSDQQDEVQQEVEKWNPEGTFPTVVIDGKDSIAGYKPDELKKRFGR